MLCRHLHPSNHTACCPDNKQGSTWTLGLPNACPRRPASKRAVLPDKADLQHGLQPAVLDAAGAVSICQVQALTVSTCCSSEGGGISLHGRDGWFRRHRSPILTTAGNVYRTACAQPAPQPARFRMAHGQACRAAVGGDSGQRQRAAAAAAGSVLQQTAGGSTLPALRRAVL